MEKELEKEQLASQGLRSEIKETEERYNSIVSDKDRLNDVLSRTVDEKSRELEKLSSYPEFLAKKEADIHNMEEQINILKEQAKEVAYSHKIELLEMERKIDQAKAESRKEMETEAVKQREKYEADLEKLREKYDQAQVKIQELIEKRETHM